MEWLFIFAIIVALYNFFCSIYYFLTIQRDLKQLQDGYEKRIKEMLGIQVSEGSESHSSSDESDRFKERYAKFDVKNRKFTGRVSSALPGDDPKSAGLLGKDKQKDSVAEDAKLDDSDLQSRISSLVSDISVSTMSDRSDLDEFEVERLIKQNVKSRKGNWESISFWDKYRLFNKWSVVSAIGNLLTIFGSVFYLSEEWFPFY